MFFFIINKYNWDSVRMPLAAPLWVASGRMYSSPCNSSRGAEVGGVSPTWKSLRVAHNVLAFVRAGRHYGSTSDLTEKALSGPGAFRQIMCSFFFRDHEVK